MKTLKAEGKADTRHNPEIPKESLAKIHLLLKDIQDMMDKNITPEDFSRNMTRIPHGKEDKLHYLAQWGAFFIVATFLCRRGREGFETLKKSHFDIFDE